MAVTSYLGNHVVTAARFYDNVPGPVFQRLQDSGTGPALGAHDYRGGGILAEGVDFYTHGQLAVVGIP